MKGDRAEHLTDRESLVFALNQDRDCEVLYLTVGADDWRKQVALHSVADLSS